MTQRLTEWFAIWHRRYAGFMMRLIAAAAVASALVYGQNALLAWLMDGLQPGSEGSRVPEAIRRWAGGLSVEPFVLIVGLFVVVRLASAGTSIWRERVAGRMQNRTTTDLEGEILAHLLRKDDSFFARHSPAETVNRLATDLARVCGRRSSWVGIWDNVLLISGSVLFFLGQDWRLAALALSGCAAGAWWAWRTTRTVKVMDADFLRHDDQVKSLFEDYLRAAPEVQVAGLIDSVRRRFRDVQQRRSDTFLKYVSVNSRLSGGGTLAFVLTFLGMTGIILYRRWAGDVGQAVALIPVVLYSLPSLFSNASQLVFVNLRFQLARTSMNRLAEYETQPGGESADLAGSAAIADRGVVSPATVTALPLQATGVTYRYLSGDGAPQGGVVDITAQFPPGQWTAIVGGAGSGKSTLLRLLLGRCRPQQGDVSYGGQSLEAMPPAERAAIMSLMPQSLALLNASIAGNVTFGRGDGEDRGGLTAEDIDVVERAGLGAICRIKALDMTAGAEPALLGAPIAEVRRNLRRHLGDTCGVAVVPYEAGGNDSRHWLAEALLGGRCDRAQAAGRILRAGGCRELRALGGAGLVADLAAAARALLRSTGKLLADANYQTYCRLAPLAIEEAVWSFRAGHAHLAGRADATESDLRALVAIALTACPAEMVDQSVTDPPWVDPAWRARNASSLVPLKAAVGEALVPFDVETVHPFLTWRENLVFGAMDLRNSRLANNVDAALREFIEAAGLKDQFTRVGLAYEIGRAGANLSGGQGQLVGLTRALLRRTPLLVLDEPTSALDPASRAGVVECLRSWRAGRVVITVSHDVELVRHADQIVVLESGRLATCGPFEQLRQDSPAFRAVMRQT